MEKLTYQPQDAITAKQPPTSQPTSFVAHDTLHPPLPDCDTGPGHDLQPGATVIYNMHGFCRILALQSLQLGKGVAPQPFYKLEKIRASNQKRSRLLESAIWVPITQAKAQGLRLPLSPLQAQQVLEVLQSREYYFAWTLAWSELQPLLEAALLQEGGLGLAKVESFLFVFVKKVASPGAEALKLQEFVHRLLFRELQQALGVLARDLELRVRKGMKSKCQPDH